MTGTRTSLARRALRASLELRRSCAIARESAVNIADFAEGVGVPVRYTDCKTLEGMYVRDPGPRIILPSTKHRPLGRIAFSCAHELGHHVFGHGTQVDEYVSNASDGKRAPDEYMADMFAAYMLMPRQAVLAAFERRGWSPQSATPRQAYAVASNLGVGYNTLLTHMRYTLEPESVTTIA